MLSRTSSHLCPRAVYTQQTISFYVISLTTCTNYCTSFTRLTRPTYLFYHRGRCKVESMGRAGGIGRGQSGGGDRGGGRDGRNDICRGVGRGGGGNGNRGSTRCAYLTPNPTDLNHDIKVFPVSIHLGLSLFAHMPNLEMPIFLYIA